MAEPSEYTIITGSEFQSVWNVNSHINNIICKVLAVYAHRLYANIVSN